jgi:hypothetical protein
MSLELSACLRELATTLAPHLQERNPKSKSFSERR